MRREVFLTSHLAEYSIREDGVIFRGDEVQIVHPCQGYLRCVLRTEVNVQKAFFPHQLVAKHFIPNPEGLPEVNHVDGVKVNCHKDNLEWSTRQGNVIHAHAKGLHPNKKTSRHYGVRWWKAAPGKGRSKWKAQMWEDGKSVYLGGFNDEDDAGRAVNDYIVAHGLKIPLNTFHEPR